jgi:hypothetical protein
MCTKTVVIRDFGGMGRWLTGGVLHELIFFLFFIFKISFLEKKNCRVFFGTRQRQKISLPTPIYRMHFAVYNTRQKICREYFGLCRVPWHTAKEPIPVVMLDLL